MADRESQSETRPSLFETMCPVCGLRFAASTQEVADLLAANHLVCEALMEKGMIDERS